MDYKTTTLNEQLECKVQLLAAFPDLKFGDISEDLTVFDSTAYYIERGLEQIDYRTFQRINKRYIDSLTKYGDTNKSELFFINKDSHILMNKELTFIFLAFAEPILATYFNGLIGDIISNGVAYSDGYVVSLASERIPSDVLQQIIDNRNNAS